MTSKNIELSAQLEPLVTDVLRQFGFGSASAIRLLSFSENAVYRVDMTDGDPIVIRLHSLGYHTKQEIESELAWIEAVRNESEVVTAPVLRTPSGESVVSAQAEGLDSRYAVVFGYLGGREPVAGNWISDFRLLGRTTALLHQHALKWQPPSYFTRFRWDLGGAVSANAHWGRWQNGPALNHEMVVTIDRAVELMTRRLQNFGQLENRFGLIHADFRLANVLMDDETVQVIDFDDCGFGWLLYDLAGALTFNEDDPMVPALIENWLKGYREVRPLSGADEAEIPSFILMRRLTLLAWLGSRPDTELFISEGPRFARVTAELAERYLTDMS